MPDSLRRRFWPMAGLLLITLAGCGVRTYSVEGTVVWPDGTPAKELAGGQVSFEPMEGEKKTSASGEIQADGTYRLSTFKDGDGALAGKHRVLVQPPPLPPGLPEDKPPPLIIDPRFESYETSGIEVMVEEGSNQIEIKVEKPKASR